MVEASPAVPARGGILPSRRWAIVMTAVVFQMAAMGVTLNCFTFFAQAWSQEFKGPISALAVAFSMMSVTIFIVVPIIGRLCDQMSVRLLVLIGVIATVLVHIGLGFVTAPWQVVAIYSFIIPVTVSLCGLIPAQTLVARWFTEKRGLALGITAFGVQLAGVVFPLIVVGVMARFGWRQTWWVFAAAIFILVTPLCLSVLKDSPKPDGEQQRKKAVAEGPRLSTLAILSRRNVIIVIFAFILLQIPYQAMAINLAPLLVSRGFSRANAAEILMLMSISAIAAKLLAGVLLDRLGEKIPLFLTGAVTAAGIGLIAFAPNFAACAFGYMLIGVAGAQWPLMAAVCASEFSSEHFGRAYGLMSMFTPLSTLGPLILARWQESVHAYQPGIVGLAGVAVLGALLSLAHRKRLGPAL